MSAAQLRIVCRSCTIITPNGVWPDPSLSVWVKCMMEDVKHWYRQLPDKKRYVEFLTAVLTVPVLITVIITNIGNLKGKDQTPAAVNPTGTTVTYVQVPATPEPTPITGQTAPTVKPTASDCRKEVGPAVITKPAEGEIINDGVLTLDIDYEIGEYCAVVWQYRINGGAWSEYTDKSVVLYGMQPGTKTLELRVKSIASGHEKLLTRNFTVAGMITPSPTPESSPAAMMVSQ